MELLTKNKIIDKLSRNDKRVAFDGWLESVSLYSETKAIQSMEFRDIYESVFTLEFKAIIQTDRPPSITEKEKAATAIFNELYGGIVQELFRIEHLVHSSRREEVEKQLRKLIDKLYRDTQPSTGEI